MSKIMIGDALICTEDIVEVSEKQITFNVKKNKPNPKPKPAGFFQKMFYCDEITYWEKETYPCWVIKVAAGTQTVIPNNSNNDSISIGSSSYGTHQLFRFYTVYNNSDFLVHCKRILEKLDDNLTSNEEASSIIRRLSDIGMIRTLYGWKIPDHLDKNMQLDVNMHSKQDVLDKYVNI